MGVFNSCTVLNWYILRLSLSHVLALFGQDRDSRWIYCSWTREVSTTHCYLQGKKLNWFSLPRAAKGGVVRSLPFVLREAQVQSCRMCAIKYLHRLKENSQPISQSETSILCRWITLEVEWFTLTWYIDRKCTRLWTKMTTIAWMLTKYS